MKTIYLNTTDLTRSKRSSNLTEDVVVSGTTLAIQSIIGFESLDTSSGQVLCVGKIGDERTELVLTSNTSGQSPSTAYKWIYLKTPFLVFDHPQDTPVTIIDFNRAEIQWAASANGTKATLFAYPFNITPDVPEMLFTDTSASAGFYFTRFNRTVDSQNSDWSDAIPYSGFDDNMVASIKKRAVDDLNEEIDGKVITHEYLNECLWTARREYHRAPGKRPFRMKYNVDIGNVLTGSAKIELPTDVEDPVSGENIYGVRIGPNANMEWYDKKEWDADYRNIPHSTLDIAYTAGTSTSLWLASGRDFSGSASVMVENSAISLSRITGEQNSFTIVTHSSYSASGGSDVWENVSYGLPSYFTVFAEPEGSAYIYFNRPFDTAYVNMNIYADYYRTLIGKDSDADVLDEPDYDMYVDYLKAKIKHRRSNGENDITKDSDYILWELKKNRALSAEYMSNQIHFTPEIRHLNLPE